ncbi:MAG: AEC family transporter [Syntrophobacteraceae bacterium]
MNRLLFSLGIILFGLSFGYFLQRLIETGVIRLPVQIASLRRGIQRVALQFFTPIPVIGAIWLIRIDDLRMAALPFLGVATLFFGGLLGWVAGRVRGYGPKKIGALYCCGSFSNIASMGSLVSFFFIGEEGFAMLALYKLFEEVTYFGIGFPVAKYYGTGLEEGESFRGRLGKVFADPFVIVAMGALITGLILNVSGIPRPAFYETVSAVFIPVGVFLLLVSVGLGMSFGRVGYLREVLLVSGIKFLAMPGLACIAAILLGMNTLYDGLPLKAVLLASSMPVAFNSVVASSLYELDLDLANSCWLVTTGAMVVVLPCLYFLLEHI